MQSNEMAEKKRVKWDGVETPGLVNVAEITREKSVVAVPGFRRIRDIQADIEKLPQISMVYKIERGTNTLQFFEDFFDKNEVKDAEIIRTDAHGTEFKRKVYTQCELMSITEPAYDAANPEFAKITIVALPFDIINV